MKIALISSYNAFCGVAQFARYWAIDLVSRGNEVRILSAYTRPEFPQIPNPYMDIPYMEVFPSGHLLGKNQLKLNTIIETCLWADVILVSYQDFLYPWWTELQKLTTFIKRPWCIYFHDTFISPWVGSVNWALAIHPESLYETTRYVSSRQVLVIDQPIPTGFSLGVEPEFPYPSFSVMGYGRNQLTNIADLVERENGCLNVLCPNDDVLARSQELLTDSKIPVTYSVGYKTDQELCNEIRSSHFAVIDYPQLGGNATSSALRFLIGCEIPILATRSGWTAPELDGVSYMDDLAEFSPVPYGSYRNAVREAQISQIARSGWPTLGGKILATLQTL